MADKDFLGALYAYPWDLADEGLNQALDRITAWTACREVIVAPAYHRASYFLPHNPRRPIYCGEDGAVYFTPNLARYQKTRLRPLVSALVTGPDYFEKIAEAIKARGLGLGLWIVYLYNDHLTKAFPDCRKQDAFGNGYQGQLSATAPDVQEYAVALTADLVARVKPTSVYIESLGRSPYAYGLSNFKTESAIAPRCQLLLGLCFHPASVAAATAAGVPAGRFQREVVEYVRPRLARLPAKEDLLPVTPEWVAEAFGGMLARHLAATRKSTTEFWLRVAEVIQNGGAKVMTDFATAQTALIDDLDPASINPRLDRAMLNKLTGDDVGRTRVREAVGKIAKGGTIMVYTNLDKVTSAAPVLQEVHAAAAAGARGATFYNYGLLREEQLRFIGEALRSL